MRVRRGAIESFNLELGGLCGMVGGTYGLSVGRRRLHVDDSVGSRRAGTCNLGRQTLGEARS